MGVKKNKGKKEEGNGEGEGQDKEEEEKKNNNKNKNKFLTGFLVSVGNDGERSTRRPRNHDCHH